MKHTLGFFVLFCLSCCFAGPVSAASLDTRFALNLEVSKSIAAAAEAHARTNDWNVVIAIVDAGGHLLYLQRMDGAQIGSVEVAIRKAESSINFKRPTKAFEDGLNGGRSALLSLPGAMVFEGGLPIIHEGHYLGAIGVSGVTAAQDGIIAQAAVDALPGILAD